MKAHKMTKKGNAKIHTSCGVFNLSTETCQQKCKGCYAAKPEKRFPKVLEYRRKNDQLATSDQFVPMMVAEIKALKVDQFRIHESGDFFSQEYIAKWQQIAETLPTVKFYFYTKNAGRFDFASFTALDNVNMVNSCTPLGFNFGSAEYCEELAAFGYVLCPCHLPEYKSGEKQCMKDCKVCGDTSKVCFLIH